MGGGAGLAKSQGKETGKGRALRGWGTLLLEACLCLSHSPGMDPIFQRPLRQALEGCLPGSDSQGGSSGVSVYKEQRALGLHSREEQSCPHSPSSGTKSNLAKRVGVDF